MNDMNNPNFIELPIYQKNGSVLNLFINISEIKWVKPNGANAKICLRDGSMFSVAEHYESVVGMIRNPE